MFEKGRAAYLILLAILTAAAIPNLVLTLLLGFKSFVLPAAAITGLVVPLAAVAYWLLCGLSAEPFDSDRFIKYTLVFEMVGLATHVLLAIGALVWCFVYCYANSAAWRSYNSRQSACVRAALLAVCSGSGSGFEQSANAGALQLQLNFNEMTRNPTDPETAESISDASISYVSGIIKCLFCSITFEAMLLIFLLILVKRNWLSGISNRWTVSEILMEPLNSK